MNWPNQAEDRTNLGEDEMTACIVHDPLDKRAPVPSNFSIWRSYFTDTRQPGKSYKIGSLNEGRLECLISNSRIDFLTPSGVV
jgi:hypothetical protein